MVSLNIHATTHAVCKTFRLLLQHEMRIATLFNLTEVDVDCLHRQFLLLSKNAYHLQFLTTTDHSDIAILQIHHLISIFHNRTGIRSQEEFIFADAHHQRTLLAGSDNLVGITLVEHSNGISTDHLIERYLYSRQQVELLMLFDILNQLHQHLRIRITHEVHALGLQFLLQISIVLDDSVMDDGQVLRL